MRRDARRVRGLLQFALRRSLRRDFDPPQDEGMARHERRLFGAGPRFPVRASRSSRPEADSAIPKSSASSWRELVVVRGGAPSRPSDSMRTSRAGAAPRSASRRLAKAPLKRTRCKQDNAGLGCGDKVARNTRFQRKPESRAPGAGDCEPGYRLSPALREFLWRPNSVAATEAAVPCRGGETGELCVAHMNQGRVISALEIDLRLLLDDVVDNHV
jgi:hypothetical protein